jgi:hypothetical protein
VKNNLLIISGGLGNQLFQYIGAKSDSEHRGLTIESALCNYESNSKREQLSRYNLDSSTKVLNSRAKAKLIRYPYNLLLRLSVVYSHSLMTTLLRFTGSLLGSIFFSLCYLRPIRVVLGHGLGFTKFPRSKIPKLYIGYFQADEYVNLIGESRLRELLVTRNNNSVKKNESDQAGEGVLTIHLRLGDYLYEDQLGVLNHDYYLRGIKLIASKMRVSTIKVFSNDINSARTILPRNLGVETIWIENAGNDAVDLLDEMKKAENFLIGNSTLSWWAARLGTCDNSLVVYPDPWFQRAAPPIGLIPASWRGIKSSWLDSGEKLRLTKGEPL